MKDIPISPRIATIKRNRQVRRLRLFILLIILFISTVGALSYFSSNPKITLNKIVITGNSIINTKDLDSYINNKLKGKYLKLFARSNFLIYPRNKIYNSLVVDFPRIEDLSIKRSGFNIINIKIKERLGSYLYCGTGLPEKKEEIGENCYFVNNDGYIFDRAPYFSGDVYFKFYTEIEGDGTRPLGLQIFPIERFHELVRFTEGVTTLGFKPVYLVASENETYFLYLKSKSTNPNPKIIFNRENNLETILDNFSVAMKEKEFANEINSKYDILSYIDLRFKNKVLYKFK